MFLIVVECFNVFEAKKKVLNDIKSHKSIKQHQIEIKTEQRVSLYLERLTVGAGAILELVDGSLQVLQQLLVGYHLPTHGSLPTVATQAGRGSAGHLTLTNTNTK